MSGDDRPDWVRDWLPCGLDATDVLRVVTVLREADKVTISLQHPSGPVRLAQVAAMLQELLNRENGRLMNHAIPPPRDAR